MTLDWHVEVLNAPLEKRINKKKTGREVVIQNTLFIVMPLLELLSALDNRTREHQPVISIYESQMPEKPFRQFMRAYPERSIGIQIGI
ncbi:hypothetical protein GCT13_06230 [Paraburkholderia sp. CNPSo 3157]|uniref:Uncharacterized protein n=1 Tax=Paraburkholderia franconis TaxID=2654983 RepID=A0A7X1TET5_9BURK|nr:hypothetical protein [Paraburkholderia franconis]MPW16541.1 hypothetical protein [Paraburkholderia franconis]